MTNKMDATTNSREARRLSGLGPDARSSSGASGRLADEEEDIEHSTFCKTEQSFITHARLKRCRPAV
jgi:hypothetical protein